VPAFFASHPEAAPFLAWVKTAKPSASYVTETYNSVNAFYLVNAAGNAGGALEHRAGGSGCTGRDSAGGQRFSGKDLVQRMAAGPLRWQLNITWPTPATRSTTRAKPGPTAQV
jgi:catalase